MTRRPHKDGLYPSPPPVLSRGGRARRVAGRVGGAVLALVLLLWARPAVAGPAPTGDQYAALEALYDATNGAGWTNSANWKTTNNNWYGVTTNSDGKVTRLVLANNNLDGMIPTDLEDLTNLVKLNLGTNKLSGTIPTELGNLSNLRELLLFDNKLSGTIPTQLGSLSNLDNKLSGTIPTQLGSLSNLTDLHLDENALSGSIPSQLGNLSNLRELDLSNNNLSGSIPSELGDLNSLTLLYLHNNNLSGMIPTELGDLSSLRWLWLHNNKLSGMIPTELGSLSDLEQLIIQNNNLSGSIPSQLGSLSSLRWLYLHNNNLSGSIPSQLGSLSSLTILVLSKNNLSGSIPSALRSLSDLQWLRLENNAALSGPLPSTFPSGLTALTDLTIHNTRVTVPTDAAFETWLATLRLFLAGIRTSAHTIDLHPDNTSPRGLWSDGATVWVSDANAAVYAYRLAGGARDTAKEFRLRTGNGHPHGLWSDGETLWVVDTNDRKLYAYGLADGVRDTAKEFSLHTDNETPRGLWSDGETVWVVDYNDEWLYAYTLAGGSRDSAKDVDLADALNRHPEGLWSDGETVWVSDVNDGWLYAYNLATGDWDKTRNFVLDPANATPTGLWLAGTTWWVADRDAGKLYAYPRTIILAPRHTNPWGMWGDGETLWVLQQSYGGMDKLYAYDLADGSWNSDEDIDFPNRPPILTGLVGDGTTFWVAEADDVLPYLSAYRMDNGHADRPKNFRLAPENGHPRGLAEAGGTLWVGDFEDLALYAYDFATAARQAANDLYLSADNADPVGLWTNGTTAWVVDFVDKHIYAYDLATKQRHPDNDIILNDSNTNPLSLWSDGYNLLVADGADRLVYEYALPQAPPPAAPEENRAPRAVADEATLVRSPGGSVVIAVLANDSDPDGDPLQIGAVTTPTRGTAAQAGAAIRYTPETEFVGTDSFTYTISDGQGATATATVTVTVTRPVSQPPTIPEEPAGPEGTVNTRGGRSGGGTSSGGESSGGESQGEAESEPTDGEQAAAVAGYLENPGPDSFQSGIGVLSGWVCEAETVTLELDGVAHVAAYGTERGDTEDTCGDTANGFGLLFNWNLLGDGEYEVVALVDGVELDRATVTVTTLGAEFLKDVAGQCEVPDFPSVGEAVTLTWQESGQNFVITDGAAPVGSSNRAGIAGVGYLENPGSNSFQSGIGVLSGWVCAAETVEIEITPESGDIARHVAGYGTERLDTEDACGDTDNGFGLLFNWNLLGDGEHEVVAYVDDVELGRATVRVTTLGEEFLRAAAGECTVEDFPTSGETVTLAWQQNQQNFVITHVE